jgi:Trypsin-like peptidase domain
MVRYIAVLALFLCVSFPGFAQQQAVVPIMKLTILGPVGLVIRFGSGFCLNPECRYIVTNYHVAKTMGKHFSIQHEPVVERWLASGPNDEGATEKGYNPGHDLAVVELRHSLARKGYHGLTYNLTDTEDLAYNQDVDIYSYPLEFNPKRKLLHFHGKYIGVSTNGLLAFSYEPNPKHVRSGASGGLIVDSQGRVLAVLADVATNQNVVLGISVNVLSAFVSKIQPYMAAQLFPKSVFVSPVAADHYPEWVPPRPSVGHLGKRPVEPPDVQLLRAKAQAGVDNMYTLIAVQSLEWGRDSTANDPQAIGYYEIRMFGGQLHFRRYPDGKKERDVLPWPPLTTMILPGDAWFSMPEMVAEKYDLQIRRVGDILWKGQKLRVFQYVGANEDKVCTLDERAYACYGEVWTDQDENIVRLSENFHMRGSWVNLRAIITFGWTEVNGRRSLVPVTLAVEAQHKSHIYWCRGLFTDYQQFQTKVRFIRFGDGPK